MATKPMETFHNDRRAFTLIELLVVIAIISILMGLLLPSLDQAKLRGKRIQCVSQQHQIGVAFHMFMHDHGGGFPMSVSTNNGGSAEFTKTGFQIGRDFYYSYRHFQALSNDMVNTKLLVCPLDTRLSAVSFAALQNLNLSYFVGVNAEFSNPDSTILAGDRNMTRGLNGLPTILRLGSNQPVRWTDELHKFNGNILFADGHVEELSQARLTEIANQSSYTPLVFPTVAPGTPSISGNPSPNGGNPSPNGGNPSPNGDNNAGFYPPVSLPPAPMPNYPSYSPQPSVPIPIYKQTTPRTIPSPPKASLPYSKSKKMGVPQPTNIITLGHPKEQAKEQTSTITTGLLGMTIWILAVLLFVLLALVGYHQGAVRVAVSLLGLIISAVMAVPLGRVVSPVVNILLGAFSLDNPVLLWVVAPVVAFLLLLMFFKVGGLMLHEKLDFFHRYKADKNHFTKWVRINQRLGACLGLVNGLIYLLLISLMAYEISYCTTQIVAMNESGPKLVRLINRMGRDVVATGMVKAVRTIDPMPQSYYEASDIIGLVYHNPQTQGRLARYPALLGLSERSEFQEIANDKDFIEMLERQAPVAEILNNPKARAFLHNSALQKEIWQQVGSDLHDLRVYIETGKSEKYGNEPILGCWAFDTAASVTALKQSKPGGFSAFELKRLRPYLIAAYGKTTFVAMPDHQAIVKNVVSVKPGMVIKGESLDNLENVSGQWQHVNGKYTISLDNKEVTGTITNDKLKLAGDWTPVVFSPEE